jgi:hypothetical protein
MEGLQGGRLLGKGNEQTFDVLLNFLATEDGSELLQFVGWYRFR